MTNYDKLIQKTPEELAHWLHKPKGKEMFPNWPLYEMPTEKMILLWLMEEVEE